MVFLKFMFVAVFLVLYNTDEIASFDNESEVDLHSSFIQFILKYDKKYQDIDEMQLRFRIFRANLKKIKVLNEVEQGTAVYGVTPFADLTKSEFRKSFLGLKVPSHYRQSEAEVSKVKVEPTSGTVLPRDFDWRSYNAVSAVKNQGMCGSCWAFSVTGNIEGQYAIKHKTLLSFSEQELVDCDKVDAGCGGGYMTDAYKAIEKLGGLELESDYPYEGTNDQCHFAKNKVKVVVNDYKNITSNETEMAFWLYENGPISIGLNANVMQFYFGGVSHPPKFMCDPQGIDHGVLLTGFGIHKTRFTKKNVPYWTIKNSWGKWWGEHGYYRLYRGAGVCGVNTMASSAIVD